MSTAVLLVDRFCLLGRRPRFRQLLYHPPHPLRHLSKQLIDVSPHVSDIGRCLAPDLTGMGQSGRSPTYSYPFVGHARKLDAWFKAMNLSKAILLIHDWGSALGFRRAYRLPEKILAIAYMEAVVRTFTGAERSELSDGNRHDHTGLPLIPVGCRDGTLKAALPMRYAAAYR